MTSHLHYMPLTLPFTALLVGLFGLLVVFIQLRVLRYAYLRLGVSSGTAMLLLLGSLIGSYFNIPLFELPGHHVAGSREVSFYGMDYVVPMLVDHPGTVVAINVGGAVIPIVMSIYLMLRNGLLLRAPIAAALVAAICYGLAKPVPSLGIALPIFVPSVAAAIVALILSRRYAAPLAYIGGSLGALIGADLLNLGRIEGLGAPVASIGGAGTFDGIFLTGIVAVLIASFSIGPMPERRPPLRFRRGAYGGPWSR